MTGVEVRTSGGSATTNSSGRYQFSSTSPSVTVSSLTPPTGYEGNATGSGLGTMTPGSRDFTTRQITQVTLLPPTSIAVSDGTLKYGVSPTVRFATGEEERLSGTREEQVRLSSSSEAVLRTGTTGGRPVIEGVAPGTATITGSYWGVSSSSVAVQVVPR